MPRNPSWRRLVRQDLRAFDNDARDAVLYAMEQGAVGRISSNGHAILRNTDGLTMSVSADSTKSREAVRINIRRLFPDPGEQTATSGGPVVNAPPPSGVIEDLTEPTLQCPAKGCEAEFATEGARYAHVRDNHKTCPEDGCNTGPDGGAYIARDYHSLAGHIGIAHRGVRPWEGHKRQVPKEHVNGRERPHSSAAVGDSADVLAAIRELLGPDPRTAELETVVSRLQSSARCGRATRR